MTQHGTTPTRPRRAASRIATALSLVRIVGLNVLALVATAVATAHVLTRPTGPAPGVLSTSVTSAVTTTPASSAAPRQGALPGASSSAPPLLEVDIDTADPVVANRPGSLPTVNDQPHRDRDATGEAAPGPAGKSSP